jgi:hypothetical protein
MANLTNNPETTCESLCSSIPEVLPEVLPNRGPAVPGVAPAALPPGRQSTGKAGAGNRVRNRQAEKAALDARMVPVGTAGRMAEHVRKHVSRLRSRLGDCVLAARGVITPVEQLAINQACRWEMVAQLALAWLRRDEDKLDPNQRLQHANSFANATTNRDKAVDRLRIGGDVKDDLAAFYANRERQATETSAAGFEGSKMAAADTLEHSEAPGAFPAASGEVSR